ncbi:MAG: methyltransferase domain-containing protein [Halobacteria archaeon]|nr:methyltransferase domain-containing protein [Halobacteria archaeon]
MPPTSEEVVDEVNEYYDECQVDYSLIWGTDEHLSMHYGYHDEENESIEDAVINLNRVVADRAGIEEGDRVLDAGCGVGGSAIWLAKNRGAEVTGVNINQKQVQKARRGAEREGVTDSVEFLVKDFTDTGLPDDHFDVVWSVESVCHAEDEREFLSEAKRVLKDGGRIVVADGFLGKPEDELSEDERRGFESMLEGMAAPNLSTVDEFGEDLESEGFVDVDFENKYEYVKPSAKRMYYLTLLTYPVAKLLRLLRIRSEAQTKHLGAAYNQYPMLEKGVWVHGLFYAEKG